MPLVKCRICKKRFYVKPRYLKLGWGKFCSKKCQFKGQEKGKWFNCANCGRKVYKPRAEIKKSRSKNFFCDKKCHCIWENKNNRSYENAVNWAGGESVYRLILERSGRARICNNCKIMDKRVIVVHHIDRDRKNNKINNLQWLCRNCHYLVHFYS